MPAAVQFADLSQPELVGQLRAPLGQLHRHGLAAGQFHAMRDELFGAPSSLANL
jgi:hypothetical protein